MKKVLDKTQLVGGSWWWDSWIGSQPAHSLEIWLRSNEGSSWIKIHPLNRVLFLSCDVFLNIFLVKLFIFIWNTMDYFFILKVVGAPSQQEKCSISLPNDSKRPLSCHNEFVMLSRQLCDVTMDWWRCHWYQTIKWQTACIFYTRSRNPWIFYTRSRWWENMDISTQKHNLATYYRIMMNTWELDK